MAVDLDDRVIDIEQRVPGLVVVDGAGGAQQPGEPVGAMRNLDVIASSWRTWPKVNERRNDLSVEGAYAFVKTRPIPP